MKLKNIILSTALLVGFCACDDLFEPAIENHKTVEDLENMPAWAVGLLGHAYISNPLGGKRQLLEVYRGWLLTMPCPTRWAMVSENGRPVHGVPTTILWIVGNTCVPLGNTSINFSKYPTKWNGPKTKWLPSYLEYVFKAMRMVCVLSICIIC